MLHDPLGGTGKIHTSNGYNYRSELVNFLNSLHYFHKDLLSYVYANYNVILI